MTAASADWTRSCWARRSPLPDGELIVCCVHHFKPLSARIDPTEPTLDHTSAQESVERATRTVRRAVCTVTPMFVAGAGTAIALQRAAISAACRPDRARLLPSRSARTRVRGKRHGRRPCTKRPARSRSRRSAFTLIRRSARLTRIAVGHDAVEPTPDALSAAVGLCEQTGAELLLVAVAEDAAVPDPARATMPYTEITQARLRAAEQSVADALTGVPETVLATGDVRDGDPAEQLLEVSRDADLLLLGSHGRGIVGRLIMGSVCDRVIRSAACPVLVVPPSNSADAPASKRLSPTISSAHGS